MNVRYCPRLVRQLYALVLAVLTLWIVFATATGPTARRALSSLISLPELSVALLRSRLIDAPSSEELPPMVAFALSQCPLLLSGHSAVLELRRSNEQDSPSDSETEPESPDSPVAELPREPDTPLIFVDNGVSARTLVPVSPEGYIVAGDVYIDNRSDKVFDTSLFSLSPQVRLTASELPQVLIVHTHGSEAYTMPPGQEYVPSGDCRTTDTACSVVRVGAEIAAVLESAGIRVLHDTTLHDYPRYSGAYDRSLTAVERYLTRYPSIVLVLDIHRDAVSDSKGNMYKIVSPVSGLNAAQMSFVIGTDGGGLSHPHWQENLRLAAAIQQALCAEHPTLMRPITVRNSRYNQHTTTGSLLIEMGAAGNSLDEALLSARLLSDAILSVLFSDGAIPPAEHVIT